MTAQPGRICEVIDVDLPRPRRYAMHSDPRFIALRERVTALVRNEAIRAMSAAQAA